MSSFVVPERAAKVPSWSWSAIKQFQTCPHRYEMVRHRKRFKADFSGPAIERGRKVHETLCKIIIGGSDMAPGPNDAWLVRLANWVVGSLSDVEAERSFMLSRDLRPTDWDAARAGGPEPWAITIADVVGRRPDGTFCLVDWKTGRYRPDEQPAVSAAIWMAGNPDIERIETTWMWIDPVKDGGEPIIDRRAFDRSDAAKVWADAMSVLEEIAGLMEGSDRWPRQPGRDCRWCEVATCAFRGKSFGG